MCQEARPEKQRRPQDDEEETELLLRYANG